MSKIAILASGNGTNAQAIINHFLGKEKIEITAVLSNKSDAFVLQRAKDAGIKTMVFSAKEFRNDQSEVLQFLDQNEVDFVVLAGYMLLIPSEMVRKYRGRMLNIHPALLPKFGGKGMYGDNVHKAVIQAQEKQSGITIHHVSEKYDEGGIVFQATVEVCPTDTPETLAQKIHQLEHKHYPVVIEQVIEGKTPIY